MSSKASSKASFNSQKYDDEEYSTTPEFIYGGPFIKIEKPDPFLNTATPVNIQLQGTFKQSFAYYSLKERLPIILTKVIDQVSKKGGEAVGLVQYIAKLKNDLITNKKYEPLTVDTPEAKKWNEWIANASPPYYFTNTWVFTECYVYRRLREGCELIKSLNDFDPFAAQKQESFTAALEAMCVVAEKMEGMLPPSDKDKRKADFVTLLKISLWANKCDLSLSMGEQVPIGGMTPPAPAASAAPPAPADPKAKATPGKGTPKASPTVSMSGVIDPFQMIINLKDKLLIDDSGKMADGVITKAEAMAKNIAAEGGEPAKGGKEAPPAAGGQAPAEGEELPKIPCPAKMTVPQSVFFDIVCDNSGYELFTDLCLAHFLISQNIVQKVRFHVKKIPWFVSDVTRKDFKYVIDSCAKATFRKEIPPEPKPAPAEGEAPSEPDPPRVLTADPLQKLGSQWQQYSDDGTFILMDDDFWTSPHCYKDMKKYDPLLYRKLQFAVTVLFKGDLNYRKLLGEKNWNPITGFEASLQGFIPAPVGALRTVKADLISGLPKGRWEQLNKIDPKWMETGDYGVIQYCAKAEPLKVGDRPCADYGEVCRGEVCPEHKEL